MHWHSPPMLFVSVFCARGEMCQPQNDLLSHQESISFPSSRAVPVSPRMHFPILFARTSACKQKVAPSCCALMKVFFCCLLSRAHLQKLMQCASNGGSKREQAFFFCMRVIRIASAIVSNLGLDLSHQIANISLMIDALISRDGPAWHRLLALEAWCEFCAQESFPAHLRVLYATFQAAGEERNGMVQITCSLERTINRHLGALLQQGSAPPAVIQARSIADSMALMLGSSRARALDAMSHTGSDAPAGFVSDSACLHLAVLCLCRTVSGIAALCGIEERGDDELHVLANKPQCNTQIILENVDVCRSMVERTWQYVLAGLQTVMVSIAVPRVLEVVLKAYTQFTHTCGALQLVGPRDKALAPLCR